MSPRIGSLYACFETKSYEKGRRCLRCEVPLSIYNPGWVCGPCEVAMSRSDAHTVYDKNGYPMSWSALEVHVLLVLKATPGQPVGLAGILKEKGKPVSKERISHAINGLRRKGYEIETGRGVGTTLVSEPIVL